MENCSQVEFNLVFIPLFNTYLNACYVPKTGNTPGREQGPYPHGRNTLAEETIKLINSRIPGNHEFCEE